jgi:hypothetical protein
MYRWAGSFKLFGTSMSLRQRRTPDLTHGQGTDKAQRHLTHGQGADRAQRHLTHGEGVSNAPAALDGLIGKL